MLIKHFLTERISVPDSAGKEIEQFIEDFLNALTTNTVSTHEGDVVQIPVYRRIEDADDFLLHITKFGLTKLIQRLGKEHFEIDSNISVSYSRSDDNNDTGAMTSYTHGKHEHNIIIHANLIKPMLHFYRSKYVFDLVTKLHNTARELINNDRYSADEGINLVNLKATRLSGHLQAFSVSNDFAAVLIHEITHIKSEELVIQSYHRRGIYNKETAKPSQKLTISHWASEDATHKKLKKDQFGNGLNDHFSFPPELEAYVQEIAYRIRKLFREANFNLSVSATVFRRNIMNQIRSHRPEINDRSKHLTPAQQRYINKLYKRVYQEIADILEGAIK